MVQDKKLSVSRLGQWFGLGVVCADVVNIIVFYIGKAMVAFPDTIIIEAIR